MMRTARDKGLACLLLLLFSVLNHGCTSRWAVRTELPDVAAEWPDHAGRFRITYAGSIRGFERTGRSVGDILRLVAFGNTGKDVIVRPMAAATGRDDRLAIADSGCRCVHLYLPFEQRYIEISSAGDLDLVSPVGVAFDDELRLYVADPALSAIHVFDTQGLFLRTVTHAGGTPLKRPAGIAYSRKNKTIYAADSASHQVIALRPGGDFLFSFGDRGDGQGAFNFPTHLTVAPDGHVFVTDTMNFRIQEFDGAGRFLSSFGHHGDGSGDFAMPKGISVDAAGIVYVVDSLFDNVQLFDQTGQFLLTLGERGSGNGQFWLPSGLFLNDHGTLYVCDTYNHRLQMFRIGSDKQ
jgi:DNA-binding beta-propeller fold protein YncE